jgi:hypothetical protein
MGRQLSLQAACKGKMVCSRGDAIKIFERCANFTKETAYLGRLYRATSTTRAPG